MLLLLIAVRASHVGEDALFETRRPQRRMVSLGAVERCRLMDGGTTQGISVS